MRATLRRRATRLLCGALLVLSWTSFPGAPAAVPLGAQPAAGKRPLSYDTYDAWWSIQGTTLSRDGQWLAYALTSQGLDGQLVVKNLQSGQEFRHPRGTGPSFTADGKFVVFTIAQTKADEEKERLAGRGAAGRRGEGSEGGGTEAGQGRGGANTQPRTSGGIMTLATGQVSTVDRVGGPSLPEESSTWVAFHRRAGGGGGGRGGRGGAAGGRGGRGGEPPAAAAAAGQTEAPGANASRARRKDNGSDLIVRNLTTGQDITIPLVSDFAWSKDGAWLAYGVSSAKPEEDGAFARKMADGTVVALHKGKGNYKSLAFDEAGGQLAFLSDQAEYDKDVAPYRLYYWKPGDAAAVELVSAATRGMAQGLVVSDQAAPRFSQDGQRLFIGTAPPPPPPAPEGAPAPRSVDIWSWQDPLLQPMQRVRAQQERNRTYRGVVHLADKRFVQLATAEFPNVAQGDDSARAIGTSDLAYRKEMSWDTTYSDVSLVDLKSGQRQAILQHWRGTPTMSPGGRYLLYFDEQEADWFTYRISDGAKVNLTSKLGLNFWREDHDSPSQPPAYGAAGWTPKDGAVVLYDKYDIWEMKPDGTAPRMITNGHGRKTQTVFRYRSLDAEERAIPTDKPLLLSANDDKTESSGFYRVSFTGTAAPDKVVMVDKAFGPVIKAKNADRVVFTQARFDEFPDLWVSDTSFKDMKKVSNANPQQAEYVWGKTELIQYINADGKTLRAIIAKPENFDPAKKYPLMVYIYEELSEGLHSYRAPASRHQHQHHPLRQQRLRRADARHRLRHGLSRRERREVRDPGRQHRPGAGLHRCEANRHPGPLVGRLPDHAPDHAHQHVRGGPGGRVGVEHGQRLRRHPLGHRHVARVPVPEDAEPHRPAAVGRAAAVHRELADLLGREGEDAVPLDSQRRRRRGAVVPGDRVLLGDAPARQGSLHVRLQRRAARPAPARQPEALDRAPGRVLRSLPARQAEAGMDGEGRALPRTRAAQRRRHVQAEGYDCAYGAVRRLRAQGSGLRAAHGPLSPPELA